MAESAIMKTLNGRKVYDEDARKELENIKNAAPGLVFDTVADMEAYIAGNAGTLKVGQDLFIRAADVPDYWWDGTAAVPVETELGEVKKELGELSEAIADKLDADKLPEAINTALEQAKASGEFDGEPGEKGNTGDKGDKGDKGDPGYTPVKGTDYFTESDKTELVSAVLAALPAAEGVGF